MTGKLVDPMNKLLSINVNPVPGKPGTGMLNHVVVLAHAGPVAAPVIASDFLFNEVVGHVLNVGDQAFN